MLCSATVAIADSAITYYCKSLVNKGFIARDELFIRWVPIVVLVFFLGRSIAYFLTVYCMTRVGRGVVKDYRCKMLAHFMRVPLQFYDKKTTGELLSKVNYDAEQVAESISDAIRDSLKGILTIIFMVNAMYYLNARMTLILLVVMPPLVLYIGKMSRSLRRQSRLVQSTMGEVTQVVNEVIQGQKTIRTFGGQPYEAARFKVISDKNWHQEVKMASLTGLSVAGMQMFGVCALALFLFLATLKPGNILGTTMDAGTFVAMMGTILALLRPIKQVATVNRILQKGLSGAQSIFELLDEAVEKESGTITHFQTQGRIEYHDVSFTYEGVFDATLRKISFQVNPGEMIALVGRSGSGKSTLVSLLLRFYDHQAGLITLDGLDIRSLRLETLRKQFSLVTQQVVLFGGTVAHNIAYGAQQEVSREAIIEAAERSYAMEFINQLPKGLETEIGENGFCLSGGQRQRIAIARALLKSAPILILDEATSALDTASERYIQLALETLMKNRTTFVIAHRLSTIQHASKVLVLDHGQIVEAGTHEELMKQNGYYVALHRAQFREELV